MDDLALDYVSELEICDRTHGYQDDPRTVYQHFASVRVCLRLYGTDRWVYDPRWEKVEEFL